MSYMEESCPMSCHTDHTKKYVQQGSFVIEMSPVVHMNIQMSPGVHMNESCYT